MEKIKKLPERRCVGCGETKLKKELIRVVKTPEGEITLDKTGKKSGRGAYICPSLACLKKARKSKRVDSSLGVAIPDGIYDRLEEEISK